MHKMQLTMILLGLRRKWQSISCQHPRGFSDADRSIIKTVRNFKKHSDSKKKWASQFEEEVNAQYAGLHQRVEQAENKM